MKQNKKPSFKEEKYLRKNGFKRIVGLDEVGRGAFAGPLVAAAVVLPENFKTNGIKDSKLLTSKKREELSSYIFKNSISYAISEVNLIYINNFGIGKATEKAFLNCLKILNNKFDFVLIDGYSLKNYNETPQKGIIHGDNISVSIASASIIAKVYRDNIMRNLHKKYPKYNFLENKGYGTKYHRDALKKYGISKVHRTSFNLQKFLD